LKGDHPFWGYRHCWAHLRYVDKLDVNKKRVYRLLKEHGLLATQTKHAVPRITWSAEAGSSEAVVGNRHDQGDDGERAAYIVLVGRYSKKIGHHCGRTATSYEVDSSDRV
jgi:hypothetical protein